MRDPWVQFREKGQLAEPQLLELTPTAPSKNYNVSFSKKKNLGLVRIG